MVVCVVRSGRCVYVVGREIDICRFVDIYLLGQNESGKLSAGQRAGLRS